VYSWKQVERREVGNSWAAVKRETKFDLSVKVSLSEV